MLSIGTMALLRGTSVQTLRLYDKKGLLPAARIDPDSGYRYYTNGQIFLFQTIRLLQRTGMSLAEIRETFQKDPVDLRSLWDSQEKAILQKQQELHEMEIMVHQQQKQLEEASLMQQHAGKGPYIKRASATLLSLPIEKEGITPKVEPDDAVSLLDQRLLSLHIIPALSYGFLFPRKDYKDLSEIIYSHTIKKIESIPQSIPEDLTLIKAEENFLAIDFIWSRENYLSYYHDLLDTARKQHLKLSSVAYEISYPLDFYKVESGKRFIAELGIRIMEK
ncbi:MerR family transcriptional regulator [Dialister hominis]|uniref:MerR family transcriptional regulator n=1 Tax=Dialister hominis TaxID=2582419 RepID=UPI003FD7FBD7